MKKYCLLTLSILLLSTPGFALKEYFGISRSIRALGMGGAFYGLSDDEYALFYNPAGLSLYRANGQGMLSINAHASSSLTSGLSTLTSGENKQIDQIVSKILDFQGKPFHAGVGVFPYYMRKHFAIGLLIAEPKFDVALLGKDFNTSVDVSGVVDSGLLVGYATSFIDDRLHIGLTLKGIYRGGGSKSFSVSEITKKDGLKLDAKELGGAGGAVDFDLGSTYELPELPFGVVNRVSLVFNNLMASRMTIARLEGPPPGLPRTMSVGWHTAFEGWKFIDNFHLLVDLAEFRLGGEENPERGARTGSIFKHVNVGLEMPFNGWFVPRVGFHQGYITAGLGINLRVMRLEFATYAEELSSTPGRLGNRRFALRLQLGGGSSSPDPVVPRGAIEQGPSEPPKIDEKVEPAPAPAPVETAPKVEPKSEPKVEPKPEPTTPAPLPDGRVPQSGEPPKEPAPLMEPKAGTEVLEERVPQSAPPEPADAPAESIPSPSAPPSDAPLPRSQAVPGDRFGIDRINEQAPSMP